MRSRRKLIWIDLETTGLNPDQDGILEVAVAVSNFDEPFRPLDGFHAVVHYPDSCWRDVDSYVVDMHTKNGLREACALATLTPDDVWHEVATLVPIETDREMRPILAGSTVHFDSSFLKVFAPELLSRFAHRHYDVSSVKLFCESLGMPRIEKAEAHRARDDIRESMRHAQLCREWLSRHFGMPRTMEAHP